MDTKVITLRWSGTAWFNPINREYSNNLKSFYKKKVFYWDLDQFLSLATQANFTVKILNTPSRELFLERARINGWGNSIPPSKLNPEELKYVLWKS